MISVYVNIGTDSDRQNIGFQMPDLDTAERLAGLLAISGSVNHVKVYS